MRPRHQCQRAEMVRLRRKAHVGRSQVSAGGSTSPRRSLGMLISRVRFSFVALVMLGACGEVDGTATPDASVPTDGPSSTDDAPDDMTGCQTGYQDEDGDGTCKISCE